MQRLSFLFLLHGVSVSTARNVASQYKKCIDTARGDWHKGGMNNQQLVAFLKKNLACRAGLEWLQARTLAEAWEQSERGDWLLWLAAKAGVDRRRLVMAACACARLALVHVPPGEERPRVAIETAEAWCRGEATIEQVRKASRNADAAARASALKKAADLVRGLISCAEVEAAINGTKE